MAKRIRKKAQCAYENALSNGYSDLDAKVIAAVHKSALEGNISAAKFWLANTNPENWGAQQHIKVTGKKGEPSVGIKEETKQELMSSILSLIKPKPDKIC